MQQQEAQRIFSERLEAVARYYRDGDSGLGYRRLMDAAMDTGDAGIYRALTDYTDWLHETQPAEALQWERVSGLLELIARQGIPDVPLPGAPLLQATGIRKQYRKGNFSLGPVDLSIDRGALLGLVGENGNGKTTLLRILARELACDEGKIVYPMHQDADAYTLRSRLAYIPQRTPKWSGSLRDNLKFTLAAYGVRGADNESRVLMVIARMGLWSYKDLDWNQLSSGYKMRFELARTLLRCPDILLLDEPLANLDIMAQQQILEDLRSLAAALSQPMGIVLSSQQLYEVEKVSGQVLFLKQGTPVYQQQTADEPGADAPLILELDAEVPKEILQQLLAQCALQQLSNSGGTYIATFAAGVTMARVMTLLGQSGINIVYIRNISRSTRRFFIS